MKLLIITLLVLAKLATNGLAAVDFANPLSGSVIVNFEGTPNATTIVCNITLSGGLQVTTRWNVAKFRGGILQSEPNYVAPELFFVGGDPFPNNDILFDNKLTILNWTAELDGVIVYCGTRQDPQQVSFTLRIYRGPKLQDFFPIKIEEGSESIPVDIRQDPFAFPEPTLFHWNKDGQPLRADLSFTYSNVTFDTIKRADAGNYTVSATNFIIGSNIEQVGNDTGGFFLDVIYGPFFLSNGPTQTPTQHYAILGDRSSLICGTGLDSNPRSTITWTAPDGTAVMDSTRYDLENGPDIVRLNLSQTIPSDNGVWVCELVVRSERYVVTSEGKLILGGLAIIGGTPLRHQFRLTVIAPPSQPRALSVQNINIGATWVYLRWEAPLEVDFPISYYEVMVATGGPGVRLVQNRSTLDNSTFINVTGLNPSTTYNFSVVAVIEAGEVVARSEESAILEDIGTTATIANTGTTSLSCHLTVVGGLLGSLLAISLLIIAILVIALILKNQREGKSLAATDEAMYEYPEVSPKSADPRMESCAAYGVVINAGHL